MYNKNQQENDRFKEVRGGGQAHRREVVKLKRRRLVNLVGVCRVINGLDVFIKSTIKDFNRKPYPAREQFLFDNINAVINKHPNDKFFIQYGSTHISKMKGDWDEIKNCESFTCMLNTKNTIVSNKIITMNIHYIVPKIDYSGYNGRFLTKEQRNALNRQSGRVYMLKTDAPESPFKEYSGYIDYLIIDNVSKYYYYNLNY